jgi:hypothetical protein
MTYKRTIHCSYCGSAGHNKSSCPDYKVYIGRLRSDYGDEHWQVARYDHSKAKRANAAKNRSCSYCGSTDHNRRSCQALKNDMAAYEAKNATYRRSFLRAMIRTGFGPGAMIERTMWIGGGTELRVVTSLNWTSVRFCCDDQPHFEVRKPSLVGLTLHSWQSSDVPLPRLKNGVINQECERASRVLVRAPEENIMRMIPAGWLDGAGDTKAIFSNKRSPFHSIKYAPFDLSGWVDEVPGS